MNNPKFNILDNLSLKDIESEAEFIPLLTTEDEEALKKEDLPDSIPILPLRNTVLFPGVVIPITATRDKSIQLINDSNKGNKILGVSAQKNKDIEHPNPEEIYSVGTAAKILRILKMPDGNTTVIIQGKKRFKIKKFINKKPYLQAQVESVEEKNSSKKNSEFDATIESIKDMALQIIQDNPNIPSEASFAIKNIQSPSFLINFVSSNMNLSVKEKQKILEIFDISKQALMSLKYMNIEYQKLVLKNDIQSRVRNDLNQQQREYYLQQQMKTIQEELGDVSYEEELNEMLSRSKQKKWSETASKHFNKEFSKLKRMNPQVAEYSVQRNYLDLFIDLPWDDLSVDNFDLKRAQKNT